MKSLALAICLMQLCCVALAQAQAPTESGESYDIAKALSGTAAASRHELAQKCGFTDRDIWIIMRTKLQEHRSNERLIRAAEAMAVALQSDTDDTEAKQRAVADYLAVKERAAATYDRLQQAVIKAVGADEDPIKLGALVVLGVVDSGRRVTCATNSAVSGGANGSLRATGKGAGLGPPPPPAPSQPNSRFLRLLRKRMAQALLP